MYLSKVNHTNFFFFFCLDNGPLLVQAFADCAEVQIVGKIQTKTKKSSGVSSVTAYLSDDQL